MGCDLLPEVVRQPDMHFLDMLHFVGEGGDEIQDGDDVCDAQGRCHDWVLGGVKVAEVHSGDYEVRMADWAFDGELVVHDLCCRDFPADGDRKDSSGCWVRLVGRDERPAGNTAFPFQSGFLSMAFFLLVVSLL